MAADMPLEGGGGRLGRFCAFFFVVPARASFALFAGFFFRAEAFPVLDFPAFLFLADMFLGRLSSRPVEKQILPSWFPMVVEVLAPGRAGKRETRKEFRQEWT